MAGPRQSRDALSSTQPLPGRTSPRADKMTPYGPVPAADSMVIRSHKTAVQAHSPRQNSALLREMTPYGPAPDLGSFDVNAWTQEKQQHQMLMRQQQQQCVQEQRRQQKQQSTQLAPSDCKLERQKWQEWQNLQRQRQDLEQNLEQNLQRQ